MTAHRRESWGKPLERLGLALRDLVRDHPDLRVVWPMHLNPAVREPIREILGGLDRILLTEPAGYPEFVAFMKQAQLILTDSGGVQEGGAALDKPVLLFRDETERPRGLAVGLVQVVGTSRSAIIAAVEAQWRSDTPRRSGEMIETRSEMARPRSASIGSWHDDSASKSGRMRRDSGTGRIPGHRSGACRTIHPRRRDARVDRLGAGRRGRYATISTRIVHDA